jgi:glycosyltransferase involved in cell wall biosynthesis
LKILQINAVYGFSSTGRTTLELATALRERGHQSYVAFSTSTCPVESGYQIGGRLGKKIHGLFSRLFGTQGYFSTYATNNLLKYIDEIRPDVVHLRNLHANYVNLKILLKYLAEHNIATVVTLHDCWFFTGRCCYYTEDNCFKWLQSCGNCPCLNKYNISWFFDRSAKILIDKKNWFSGLNKLAVIGVSDWIANEAKQSILKNATVIKRIYNWIDLDVFKPLDTVSMRQRYDLENAFVILGVAQSWSKHKGLDVFIEVARELKGDAVILLVGNMADDTSLPSNVKCVAAINESSELAMHYSMADVFLNPSIQETFGKVTAEALSCGTPVIVFNETASPEIAGNDGTCGYVTDKNDIQQITSAIEAIRKNGKVSYTFNCRNRALEMFDKNHGIDEYIKVYEHLVYGKISCESASAVKKS